jgi:hypothetical protein
LESKALADSVFLSSLALALSVFLESKKAVGEGIRGISPLRRSVGLQNKRIFNGLILNRFLNP